MMTMNSDPPHVIDDKYKKVYVVVSNWTESANASDWVKENYPGYTIFFVTEQTFKQKQNNECN